jgi:hypothetical protein
MTILLKLATRMLAVLSIFAMVALPAAAQGLSASDMAFAFGGKAAAPAAAQQTARAAAPKAAETVAIASARGMTHTEMQETEGAALWFAPAVFAGARYAVTHFTKHGMNQAITRGVSSQSIVNTLRNPGPGSRSFISGPSAGTTQLRGPTSTVAINRDGGIVSTWRSSGRGW